MEAVRLDPASPIYHENLGRAFRKKGMWKEAERELSETARLVAQRHRGLDRARRRSARAQKKLDEAAAAFTTALALDPARRGGGRRPRRRRSRAEGKLAEAETALLKAVESNTKSPALWNNLGVVRVDRGAYRRRARGVPEGARRSTPASRPRRPTTPAPTELAALEKAAS